MHFIQFQVVQSYSSIDMATAWKNLHFILYREISFHKFDFLLIAVYALPMHMLTSLSVDEILLLRYMNWSTYFRDLPFKERIVPS